MANLRKKDTHRERVSQFEKYLNKLKLGDLPFLSKMKVIRKRQTK